VERPVVQWHHAPMHVFVPGALYIRLVEGEHQCRTLRLTDEVALNLGEGDLLVGVEILDARKVLGAGQTPTVQLENLQCVGT